MNEKARTEVINAFNALTALPVSGDGVDLMYVVRGCLRRAIAALEEDQGAAKDG